MVQFGAGRAQSPGGKKVRGRESAAGNTDQELDECWEAGEALCIIWTYAGEGTAHPVWLRSPHIPWEHVGPKKSMEKG